jgi:Fe2+ or Zn2+ uptake regulation protein
MIEQGHGIHHDSQQILLKRGVKPSFQRMLILEYVMKQKNHPSAEMIYKRISKEIPTLSRTTIYNNLNLFVKEGILTTLKINDSESRYDFAENPHSHFHCSVCGRIIDIELHSPIFSKAEIEGHKIDQIQIHFNGICKDCQKKGDGL